MASIKISNLPDLTPDRVTNNDYFIVNDENQTTTKLRFADLVTAISDENITFTGVVRFTGGVNVDVIDDTSSNVYTKNSVNVLISESEARSEALINENKSDITRLVSLTKAPSTGGIYLNGTFSGAAAAATNLVDAVNAVANQSTASKTELDAVEAVVNTNATNIGQLQAITSDHGNRIVALEDTVNGTPGNPGFEDRIAANEVAIAALDDALNDATTGVIVEITSLKTRVDAIETSLTAGEGGIKDEVDANAVLAQQGVDDAAAASAEVDSQRTDIRGALANISSGLDTFGTSNQTATGNEVIAELVRLINLELGAGGNLEA